MMRQTEIKKFLIIGGGLAGTSLAHHLLQRNQSVQIIDGGENHSTRVAAGMVNPLVFRRTTLSWRAADFLQYSWDFYKSLERLLNITLAEPLVIRRIFPSEQEREEWIKKQELPDFQAHLTPLLESETPQKYKTAFGTGLVKSGFFVHAQDFYLKNRTYFMDLGLLKSKKFIPSLLDPISGSYENEVFDHIIFCTGYKNSSCPFFKNVPVKSTKGQTLEIKSTIKSIFEDVIFDKSDIQSILDLLIHDKKNEYGNIQFALIEGIGKIKINQSVENELIKKSFLDYKS